MKPKDIINDFGLKEPIFYNITKQGHFGSDAPWENVDQKKLEDLHAKFK